MWAGWEYYFGFDPMDPADANVDSDGDGFVNKCENKWNTHPKDPTSFPSQGELCDMFNQVIGESQVPRVVSMSWWIFPTTADVGIRSFSNTLESIIRETTLGIQEYQLLVPISELNSIARQTSTWAVPIIGEDLERGLVRWLEEVLYRGYGEGQWLVDVSVSVSDDYISGHVSWIDSDLADREIEVKAITMHELILEEVPEGVTVSGKVSEVPDFEGPGWTSQVILDIQVNASIKYKPPLPHEGALVQVPTASILQTGRIQQEL